MINCRTAFVIAACGVVLTGCLTRSPAALNLNSDQISRMSDSKVCEALIDLGSVNQLSSRWLREAQQRKLSLCVEQGHRVFLISR